MKCINCGAELNNNHVCEYCNTDYSRNNKVSGNIDGFEGYITIGGKEVHVYVSEIEVDRDVISGYTLDGKVTAFTSSLHRRIVLQEY